LAPLPRPYRIEERGAKTRGQRGSTSVRSSKRVFTHGDNSTDHELKESLLRSESSDLNKSSEGSGRSEKESQNERARRPREVRERNATHPKTMIAEPTAVIEGKKSEKETISVESSRRDRRQEKGDVNDEVPSKRGKGERTVNHTASTKGLSVVEGEESSEETSNLVDSDDGSLDGSSVDWMGERERKQAKQDRRKSVS